MKSRMDRYYQDVKNVNENRQPEGRASRNQDLYKKKDYNIYSSNETIIDTSNEVDISKIKNIIKNREDYQRAKSYRNMLNDKSFEPDDIPPKEDQYDEKDYDINALLQKVKENKNIDNNEEKVRKLRNTQYDILSKLDLKSKEKNKNSDIPKEELQDLINTITHKDEDASMDLLDSLKSENTTIIKAASELEKEITLTSNDLKNIKEEKEKEVSKDFYSDSFTFSKKDFEEFQDSNPVTEVGSGLITVLIIVLSIIILAVGLLVADSIFDFIPFI